METPLVSVCIITYNSSEYILEALESVKDQTYKNIELIVADDCSSDDTVALCNRWIAENKKRFVRVEVIVPPHNTGTSANYNRAVKASRGEWIKIFDGDDFLAPNCIEDNIAFVSENSEALVVFSEAGRFKNGYRDHTVRFYDNFRRTFFNNDVHGQLLRALHNNDMSSATFFIKAQLLKDNPYNERYGLLEDMPKWIDLLRKGNKFYFFDKEWQLKRLNVRGKNAPKDFTLPKPSKMDDMFVLAEKLSQGIPFVRVDLYESEGKIYFGELTFFPDGGLDENILPEADEYFGNLICLED